MSTTSFRPYRSGTRERFDVNLWTTCLVTGKRQFRDRIAADFMLRNIALDKRDGILADHRRETRSYQCPHCKAWHLTSQP
ncbi:hypothetical protein [Arthrobacter sp. OY3WO11]|uniref:hypothetical protein n=1 Tax=Arthrobacter sp. OY3WO11 TaxID=1835723 RepID=UPI0007CF2E01|nr:hypothetical protein [Arthrobacter sp. OY3WO11]OAD97740.1 hypothetical protein A6A22_20270 [Arthrobacter sp. OY3WO11]